MRLLIEICLLSKSALKRKFTWFDIKLAIVAKNTYVDDRAPEWLSVIGNMEREESNTFAFGHFLMEIQETLDSRFHRWMED